MASAQCASDWRLGRVWCLLANAYEFQGPTAREAIRKGRAAEKATDVLEVLDARGLAVTDAARERILGCTDLELLGRWLRRAVTVTASDALFE